MDNKTKWKKLVFILGKIFFLPPRATLLVAVPSFAFVAMVLVRGIGGAPAYLAYFLSAYALVLVVTGVVRMARVVRAGWNSHPLVKKVLSQPFCGRFFGDVAFRAEVALYPGLLINLLYAAAKMVSGILYHSIWLATLAIYYILLALMRFLVLVSARRKHAGAGIALEWRRYRVCGVLLAFMNLTLSGMVLFMIRQDGGYAYPGVLIYVMALYAFYAVVMAVVNLAKFRRHKSPVLSAAKAINLTAALVSMLALEMAMLVRFGQADGRFFRRVMMAASGAVVCGFVFAMAIYMVVRATRQLKRLEVGGTQPGAGKIKGLEVGGIQPGAGKIKELEVGGSQPGAGKIKELEVGGIQPGAGKAKGIKASNLQTEGMKMEKIGR